MKALRLRRERSHPGSVLWVFDTKVPLMRYALACIFSLVFATTAGGQDVEQKLAGDVVSVQGTHAEIRAGDKTVAVAIPDDVRISGRSPADLEKLTAGAFVGTTAVTQADGTLLASEVHIFPESMRGRGEGHRPMDNQPGSTMTNATIARVGPGAAGTHSTMTNATVADVAAKAGGRSITLTYKGGEKTVFVPEKTPVMMVETADRKDLAAGAHVVVYAASQPDGTLAAKRITVGLKGLVPPL